MRIAIISPPPERLWVDKLDWLIASFAELGHDVRRVHHVSALPDADDWADVVLFDQYAAGLPPGNFPTVADNKRSVWVQCWRDLLVSDPTKPVARQEACSFAGRVMKCMDAVFVKERARVGEYKAAGVNAAYLDCQGCPADMGAVTYADKPEFDVLVLGQADRAYADRRLDVAALLTAGYRVLWAGISNTAGPNGVHGHKWVHPLKELPALASRCAVAFSVDVRCEPGYTSDRTYLLAGCGIPVIARVPEIDADWGLTALAEVAPQADVASWFYSDHQGMLACVKAALAEPGARVARGRQGRERVMQRHTYRDRAEAILSHVESLQAAGAR